MRPLVRDHWSEDDLVAYLDHELQVADMARIHHHLARGCVRCRRQLERLQLAQTALAHIVGGAAMASQVRVVNRSVSVPMGRVRLRLLIGSLGIGSVGALTAGILLVHQRAGRSVLARASES